MNILWIVNIIFPYPAKKLNLKPTVFGGWLNSLLEGINCNKEINSIGIATIYNGKELKKFQENNISYYLIPCKNNMKYNSNMESFWKEIVRDFKPDITHIHGTEFPHSLTYLNSCPEIKNCVSIQGLVSVCGQKEIYNANIKFKDMLKSITIRDILKKDLLIWQHKSFLKRGKYEKEILKKCDLIIGRTKWDKENAYLISGKDKYKKCNESLRKTFYEKKWIIKNIKRHTIFVSQASYPLKGFHQVLKMIKELKNKYPDILVYVAGEDITKYKQTKLKDKIKLSGYGNYLRKIIKKDKLENNIEFLGLLNEQEMCDYLLKSNLFLQASRIENSSNSLGEAMLLGMPIVASNVGGTNSMIENKKEGLLYRFDDISSATNYISDIFENDELAINMGKNAKIHAEKTHSIENNVKTIINIYKEMVEENEK